MKAIFNGTHHVGTDVYNESSYSYNRPSRAKGEKSLMMKSKIKKAL